VKQISTFASEGIPVLLVCNKADLVKKQVSEREAHSLAKAYKMDLMMTSCEKNVNVEEAIYELCKLIKKTSANASKLTRQDLNDNRTWCAC
jgi:GTPase involved in cell partitioning and DNA repair